MSDLFADRSIRPMLIGADGEAFDDPDYIYELKLDGERCIAYLDPKTGTELINKRQLKMLSKVPELSELHRHVKKRCILDGELFCLVDGKPDFSTIQRRSLMSNRIRIDLAARQYPASFVAFDILVLGSDPVMDRPLMERKKLLQGAVKSEEARFAVSRYVEEKGIALYEQAAKLGLEGVVAKRRDSVYVQGKRTKDWIKIKNLLDDDFVVCGWLPKENGMISLVLGQYRDGALIYKGHVTLGVGGRTFRVIASHPRAEGPPFAVPPNHEEAEWIRPELVCTVKYMERTASGGLRHAVFKGLRDDKGPEECAEP